MSEDTGIFLLLQKNILNLYPKLFITFDAMALTKCQFSNSLPLQA